MQQVFPGGSHQPTQNAISIINQICRIHAMQPNVFADPYCIYHRGYAQTNRQTTVSPSGLMEAVASA